MHEKSAVGWMSVPFGRRVESVWAVGTEAGKKKLVDVGVVELL